MMLFTKPTLPMLDVKLRDQNKKIIFIIRRKYPFVSNKVDSKGEIQFFSVKHPERINEVDNYKQVLLQMIEEDLDKLYTSEYSAFLEEERKNREAEKIASQQKAKEKEARLFFNLPNAYPDYDLWAKRDYWLLEEAVALLLNRSPDVVSLTKISHFQSSPFVKLYQQTLETLRRSWTTKEIESIYTALFIKWEYAGIKPSDCIAWAERKQITVPSDLKEKVQAYQTLETVDWKMKFETCEAENQHLKKQLEESKKKCKSIQSQKACMQKELSNVKGVLAAIINEKYKGNQSTTTLVVRVCELSGLDISDETIKKYIKDGEEIINK